MQELSRIGKGCGVTRSDSVKRHLPIEYAPDLIPVVAAKGSGASWNARGRQKPLDFSSPKEYGGIASWQTPERLPDTSKATRGGRDQLVFGETATNQYAKRLAYS
jgi:hypothetical protein